MGQEFQVSNGAFAFCIMHNYRQTKAGRLTQFDIAGIMVLKLMLLKLFLTSSTT